MHFFFFNRIEILSKQQKQYFFFLVTIQVLRTRKHTENDYRSALISSCISRDPIYNTWKEQMIFIISYSFLLIRIIKFRKHSA